LITYFLLLCSVLRNALRTRQQLLLENLALGQHSSGNGEHSFQFPPSYPAPATVRYWLTNRPQAGRLGIPSTDRAGLYGEDRR
jgi:hypothetical protein